MSSAIPSFAFPDMDTSHLPDKMDVGSSPFPQADDLDVDLDPFRDPSVIEDEMIDYQDDLVDPNDGLMQDLPDDDMIDQASTAGHDFDYNMDSFVEQPPAEEEDILYEDDEENNDDIEAQPDVDQSAAAVAGTDDQTNPNGPDHTNNFQNEDNSAMRDPNHDKVQDSSAVIDGPDHTQDSTNPGPPHLDEQQDVESSSGHPKQILRNLEQQEEGFLDDSENVENDSAAHHQEDNSTHGAGVIDSLVPHHTAPASPDAHSEDAQDTNETQTQKAHDVHPVTLVYLEEEMSLFPPMFGDDSTVYFLSDPSLAFESLDKLLAACREILTGTLDHHDELVLDVPGLGLHICEDSKYSAKITLADVLEVYLNLCHNDADGPSEPLYCHLSSRVSLASQYAYLSSAGADGKTYAEIAADHIDTPLEDSTHADAQVYPQEDQDESVDATEYQSEHVEDEESSKLPPASSVEGQIQSSEDTFNPQRATEKTITGVDGHSPPQDPGVRVLEQDKSAEASTGAHDPNSVEHQEQHADFDTLDDEDQEAYHDESNHEQVHEIETNSSHTVEAYQDDIEDQEPYDEGAEGEDLFSLPNQDPHQQDNADYGEHYGDEAVFAEGDVGQEVNPLTSALVPEGLNGQTLSETIDQERFEEEDTTAVGLDDLDDESESGVLAKQEDQVSIVPSPPITPSKAKLAKRKAEADDELDFLDISTPEPKRRRPS